MGPIEISVLAGANIEIVLVYHRQQENERLVATQEIQVQGSYV